VTHTTVEGSAGHPAAFCGECQRIFSQDPERQAIFANLVKIEAKDPAKVEEELGFAEEDLGSAKRESKETKKFIKKGDWGNAAETAHVAMEHSEEAAERFDDAAKELSVGAAKTKASKVTAAPEGKQSRFGGGPGEGASQAPWLKKKHAGDYANSEHYSSVDKMDLETARQEMEHAIDTYRSYGGHGSANRQDAWLGSLHRRIEELSGETAYPEGAKARQEQENSAKKQQSNIKKFAPLVKEPSRDLENAKDSAESIPGDIESATDSLKEGDADRVQEHLEYAEEDIKNMETYLNKGKKGMRQVPELNYKGSKVIMSKKLQAAMAKHPKRTDFSARRKERLEATKKQMAANAAALK